MIKIAKRALRIAVILILGATPSLMPVALSRVLITHFSLYNYLQGKIKKSISWISQCKKLRHEWLELYYDYLG